MRRALPVLLGLLLALTMAAPAAAYWPVDDPDSFVSQWQSSRHPGVDIAADYGAPVTSALHGVVSFAGYVRNCGGYQVYIWHWPGRYTAYYHLSKLAVQRGAKVRAGQTVIGYIGSTGSPPSGVRMTCSTGPHLHFEAWRNKPWTRYAYRIYAWRYINSGELLPARYQ